MNRFGAKIMIPNDSNAAHGFVDAAILIFLAALCNLVKTVVQDSFDIREEWGHMIAKEVLRTTDNLL